MSKPKIKPNKNNILIAILDIMTAVCNVQMAVTLEMTYNHMCMVQMYKEGGQHRTCSHENVQESPKIGIRTEQFHCALSA